MDGSNLPARRSLARNLAIVFSAFVALASLGIALWMSWWQGRQSLERLRDSAVTNGAFVEGLRLPKSQELEGRLSKILGGGVGFYFGDSRPGAWPTELDETVRGLGAERGAAAARSAGFAVAVAPFSDGPGALVLFRESAGFFAGAAGAVLGLIAVFTLACAALGILVGRRLVRPLGTLARWLPNLDPDAKDGPAPMPGAILNRGDEIGELARALGETGNRLRRERRLRRESERLATLGSIATGLAHEIKNPAAAIDLHAALLEDQNGPRREVGAGGESGPIALIREEVGRIMDLVNQWLFVARPRPAKKGRHDLCALLVRVARRVSPVLEHARARLLIDSSTSAPVPVEIDAPRVEQAFRNLFLNAAQAMPEGGEIRVGLEVIGNLVAISVEDDGPGFSEEARRRFGEPFFSEREGGMGIGLTLAREVFAGHGGSLKPGGSESGEGARVTCSLPLSKQHKGGDES